MEDLKAAYCKLYVGYTDHCGADQGTVFLISFFSERPMAPTLSGAGAKFTALVLLRKRQV
jgi:hypothetical protein